MRVARWMAFGILVLCPREVAADTFFTANLNGAQVNPPNGSAGTGFGRVTLNDAETMITVSMYYSGLSGSITGGHYHGSAPPGMNAPILFNLNPTTGVMSGSVVNATFAVTPSQVADLKAGLHYLDLHSSPSFLGGEIRGQLVVDSVFTTTLSGRQEAPANMSTATGRGIVSLNAAGTQALVTVRWNDLTNAAIMGHVHAARSGINGPIICDLMPPAAVSGAVVDFLCNFTPTQVSQLRARGLYLNVHTTAFPAGEIRGQLKRAWSPCDFEGDGKSDHVIVRNTGSALEWWVRLSSGGIDQFVWGLPSDFNPERLLCPDVDGDGKADATIWRSGVSATFWSRLSTGGIRGQTWGTAGDDPRMIGDYDGDGRDDYTVYRPGNPGVYWILESSTAAVRAEPWGIPGDVPQSVPDYDGDGKEDFGVRRGGTVWRKGSTGLQDAVLWGLASDSSQSADYDGDGKADVGISRLVSSHVEWWIRSSLTGQPVVPYGNGYIFGTTGDLRTTADFDGDGRLDVAVWRAGTWWIQGTSAGLSTVVWGMGSDVPLQSAFWK